MLLAFFDPGRPAARAGRLAALGLAAAVLAAASALPAAAEDQPTIALPMGNAPFTFADVVEKVKGSVVSIYITGNGPAEAGGDMPNGFPDLPDDHPLNEFFKRFKKQPETPSKPVLAQGSGFVISEDGYAVTNNHVIEDATKIEVSFDESERIPADLIGTDPRTDIALIKLKLPAGRKVNVVSFAKKPVRVGDWVLAVGNPFGLGGTVTAGIVSAGHRDIGSGPYDYIQIDAAVNKGNSGGPAFDLNGEVIGVNTAIFSPSGGNVGIAFAVPAALAMQVVEQLKTTGSVKRGWLGVHIQNVTDDIASSLGMTEAKGALITKITVDGPAAGTDLKVGDAVVAVNGDKIGDSRDLARKIADMAPGAPAALTVMRDGKQVSLTIKLGQFPDNKELAKLEEGPSNSTPETTDLADLGMSLAPASVLGKKDQKGVLITKVETNSEAADKGLQPGDIILEVAGEAVAAPGDVVNGVKSAKERGRKAVLLRIKSGEEERFVPLKLDKG